MDLRLRAPQRDVRMLHDQLVYRRAALVHRLVRFQCRLRLRVSYLLARCAVFLAFACLLWLFRLCCTAGSLDLDFDAEGLDRLGVGGHCDSAFVLWNWQPMLVFICVIISSGANWVD